jgi:ferredoxin
VRQNKKSIFVSVIVFSPFGNTLKIGEYIQKVFTDSYQQCKLFNLTGKSWREISTFNYSLIEKDNLLVIGSPIYSWKVVEAIKKFIDNLPKNRNCKIALFTTYGMITGYALLQGANLLQKRGYKVLACLKVAARHSMIFKKEEDVYWNRPNQQDMKKVRIFSKYIIKILKKFPDRELSLKKLDYHSWKIKLLYKFLIKRFGMALLPNTHFNPKICTQCGKCVEACPVQIIKLIPFPKKFGHCIKCYNCMWTCPVNAVYSRTLKLFNFFHKILGIIYHEIPETKIYV